MAILSPKAGELKERAFNNINDELIKDKVAYKEDSVVGVVKDLNGLYNMMCYIFDESKEKYSLNNRLIMYGQLLEHGLSEAYMFSYDADTWKAIGQTVRFNDGLKALSKKQNVKVNEKGEVQAISENESKQRTEVLFDVVSREFTINELGLMSYQKRELYNSLCSKFINEKENNELKEAISSSSENLSNLCEFYQKIEGTFEYYLFGLQMICSLSPNCMIDKREVISEMDKWTGYCIENQKMPSLSSFPKVEEISKIIDMQTYKDFKNKIKEDEGKNDIINLISKNNDKKIIPSKELER